MVVSSPNSVSSFIPLVSIYVSWSGTSVTVFGTDWVGAKVKVGETDGNCVGWGVGRGVIGAKDGAGDAVGKSVGGLWAEIGVGAGGGVGNDIGMGWSLPVLVEDDCG